MQTSRAIQRRRRAACSTVHQRRPSVDPSRTVPDTHGQELGTGVYWLAPTRTTFSRPGDPGTGWVRRPHLFGEWLRLMAVPHLLLALPYVVVMVAEAA